MGTAAPQTPRMILYILPLLFYSVSGQGIFNVVRFPNTACGSANNFNGTCYTASECSALGGSSSGSCASGFGVCCVFSLSCGGRTNANTSYATVSSFSTTSDRDPCTYTYCRCSEDVCKLRIDFETMVIADPVTTISTPAADNLVSPESFSLGDCLTDTLTVSVPGMTSPPVICGYNTGQHMFVPACPSCVTITLDIDTGTTTTRNWQIKVTQYECGNQMAPEEECLQYHTADTGIIANFNWDSSQTTSASVLDQVHLSDQYYNICIGRGRGYCSICYSPRITGEAGGAASFGLTACNPANAGDGNAGSCQANVGSFCTGYSKANQALAGNNAGTIGLGDYLNIPNLQLAPGTAATISGIDKICGGVLHGTNAAIAPQQTICSFDTPFRVGVHFDSDDIVGQKNDNAAFDHLENMVQADGLAGKGHTGFQLDYWQNTC